MAARLANVKYLVRYLVEVDMIVSARDENAAKDRCMERIDELTDWLHSFSSTESVGSGILSAVVVDRSSP